MAKTAKPQPAAAPAAEVQPQPQAKQVGPWVTSSRHPERGVHQIDPRDFDPRRHTKVPAPVGLEAAVGPDAGDGAPEPSVQEAAEQAAAAAATQPAAEPAEG